MCPVAVPPSGNWQGMREVAGSGAALRIPEVNDAKFPDLVNLAIKTGMLCVSGALR